MDYEQESPYKAISPAMTKRKASLALDLDVPALEQLEIMHPNVAHKQMTTSITVTHKKQSPP